MESSCSFWATLMTCSCAERRFCPERSVSTTRRCWLSGQNITRLVRVQNQWSLLHFDWCRYCCEWDDKPWKKKDTLAFRFIGAYCILVYVVIAVNETRRKRKKEAWKNTIRTHLHNSQLTVRVQNQWSLLHFDWCRYCCELDKKKKKKKERSLKKKNTIRTRLHSSQLTVRVQNQWSLVHFDWCRYCCELDKKKKKKERSLKKNTIRTHLHSSQLTVRSDSLELTEFLIDVVIAVNETIRKENKKKTAILSGERWQLPWCYCFV